MEKQIIADTELNSDVTSVNWFWVYIVHSRSVKKLSDGKSFLAGDAADTHAADGEQGMSTDIQDGFNFARKLATTLRVNAAEKNSS